MTMIILNEVRFRSPADTSGDAMPSRSAPIPR